MTRSVLILTNCLLLLLVISACSRTQGPAGESAAGSAGSPEARKISSAGVVKAAAQLVEIPAGGAAEATVKVTVESGYHINSNPPTYPFLKATDLQLEDTEEITVDYIYYPNPLVKKFAFAEKPLHVYEGETSLRINLQVAQKAAKGNRTLPAKLHIQACDEQICYPPGAIDVPIQVLIK